MSETLQRMRQKAGSHQGQGENSMGQGEPAIPPPAAVPGMDVAAVAAGLNRIADAGFACAAAMELLARATAGEFDEQGGEVERQVDMAGRPL
jgi:hypothetical protein